MAGSTHPLSAACSAPIRWWATRGTPQLIARVLQSLDLPSENIKWHAGAQTEPSAAEVLPALQISKIAAVKTLNERDRKDIELRRDFIVKREWRDSTGPKSLLEGVPSRWTSSGRCLKPETENLIINLAGKFLLNLKANSFFRKVRDAVESAVFQLQFSPARPN
jgi:hypothetical protein